jgi:hypothetical protein
MYRKVYSSKRELTTDLLEGVELPTSRWQVRNSDQFNRLIFMRFNSAFRDTESPNAQLAAFLFHTKIPAARKPLILVAREGIEPPTRGFSVSFRGFQGFVNQPLAASCRPLPRHTKAQSWHTKSQFDTFLAHRERQPTWPNSSNSLEECFILAP